MSITAATSTICPFTNVGPEVKLANGNVLVPTKYGQLTFVKPAIAAVRVALQEIDAPIFATLGDVDIVAENIDSETVAVTLQVTYPEVQVFPLGTLTGLSAHKFIYTVADAALGADSLGLNVTDDREQETADGSYSRTAVYFVDDDEDY